MSGATLQLWNESKYKKLIRGESHGMMAGAARAGLILASYPYGLVIRARNLLFSRGWQKSYRSPLPVLSVGNLTVGGTGKTPVVEWIARRLRQRGLRVTLLSRGYGNRDGCNDEALLLEQNLPDVPHLQGADRVELATIAQEELDSQVLILDDGFQHRRLARDIDLVLIDATDPFGGGRLLPAGLLREPISSLRRATIVGITRCDTVPAAVIAEIEWTIRQYGRGLPILKIRFRPTCLLQYDRDPVALADVPRGRILAFCGIGNPEPFWESLRSLGFELVGTRAFADHQDYTRRDVDELTSWARSLRPDMVITTQKDAVKLPLATLADIPLLALKIEAEIMQGSEQLEEMLDRLVEQPPADQWESQSET